MATSRSDVERYRESDRQLRAELLVALDDFFARNSSRERLLAYVRQLIEQYGSEAARAGADFFAQVRRDEDITSKHKLLVAPPRPAEAVEKNLEWALSPLTERDGSPEDALARLRIVADREVAQRGRDSIHQNIRTDRENPKWARVPTGADPCEFCLILASRGFVYASDKTAKYRRSDFETYHANCHCIPVQQYSNDPLLEGYDPDRLYAIYQRAREEADGISLNAIAAALREMRANGWSYDDILAAPDSADLRRDPRVRSSSASGASAWFRVDARSEAQVRRYVDEVLSADGSVWTYEPDPLGGFRITQVSESRDTVESVLAGRPRASDVPLPSGPLPDARPGHEHLPPLSGAGRGLIDDLTLSTPGDLTWSSLGANPGYLGDDVAFRTNATYAAVAAELRLRGWDVVARPMPTNQQVPLLREMFSGAQAATVEGPDALLEHLYDFGAEATGVAVVMWASAYGGSTTTLNWTLAGGTIVFFDAVSGRTLTPYDIQIAAADGYGISVLRLDQAEITDLGGIALPGRPG